MFYFCKISQKTFQLWSAVIGQSASVYKHRMKRRRCWLSKVYFQCESAYFRNKNFEILISKQEAFKKCWAHSPLRAAHAHSPGVATVASRLHIDIHDDANDNDNA